MTPNMHVVCLFLLLLPKIFILPVFGDFQINLTENYFNEKFIKAATVIGCFNKREHKNVAKKLMLKFHPVSVLNLNRNNVQKSLITNHQQIGVVLDGDCRKSEEFLIMCGQQKFFDVKHHWLVVSNSPNITNKFNKVILNIDADIHLAIKGLSNTWSISDIYNPASEYGGILIYEKIGTYAEGLGYNARIKQPKYWKRRNMTGVTLTTIVVLLVPFEGTLEDYLHNEDNRTINTFNRFQHKLLRFCRDYYNYTMNTQLGNSWGYPLPNGSFDGMVGALERKLIHFGSSPIFVREDRSRVIDYGRSTWSFRAGFLFRSPKSRTSIEIFLKPLSTSIWLITGFFAIVSVVILKMVTTFEKKRYLSESESSWSLSVIFTIGAFCQQGSPDVPKMACGRITAISILVLSVMIYQFYSASIVSNLLMKPTNKIKTLKDLMESSLNVGCEDIIYNRDLFEHTSDKFIKQFYSKKIYGKRNTSHFWPTKLGIDLVRSGGYAFHIEVARAYPTIETSFSDQAICELREVKLFTNTDLYNTYQKGSPFYDMLETCFQRLAEYGILFREKRFWHPRKPECIQDTFVTFHVGLDEFYPALLILLIGIVISLIVLIAEKHISLMKSRVKQPSQQLKKTKFPFTK